MNSLELQQLLIEADNAGHVPLIESKHGIGKSTICANYAQTNDLHYEPLILSLMDTGDLLGMPQNTTVGGLATTNWAAPDWYSRVVNAAWPESLKADQLTFIDNALCDTVLTLASNGIISRGDLNNAYCDFYDLPNSELQLLQQENVGYKLSKRSVILIDEMNRSLPDILNASLQFILDKRLHSHKLPRVGGKDTFVIAAINPADQNYTVSSFDPALLDRFVYCTLDPSPEQWLSWARNNDVHELVTDFIANNPNKLHFVPEDGSKGASNRSFDRLSTYLHSINGKLTDISPYYIFGTIGNIVGSEFIQFINTQKDNLTVAEVEKVVSKAKDQTAVVEVSKLLTKKVAKVEAIKRMDLAAQLQDKYVDEANYVDALPYMAYLHALPVETLTAYLKTLRNEKVEAYNKLVKLDSNATQKDLFFKITSMV